jgi:hypothetical protein
VVFNGEADHDVRHRTQVFGGRSLDKSKLFKICFTPNVFHYRELGISIAGVRNRREIFEPRKYGVPYGKLRND